MARWFLKFASYKTPNDIFKAIKAGEKTIETRPRNPESSRDCSKIVPGDTLVMHSNETGERIEKTVAFVHVYNSVKELAVNEPVKEILPGIKTKNEFVDVFEIFKRKWGKKYKDKLEKFGIVAIGFK